MVVYLWQHGNMFFYMHFFIHFLANVGPVETWQLVFVDGICINLSLATLFQFNSSLTEEKSCVWNLMRNNMVCVGVFDV